MFAQARPPEPNQGISLYVILIAVGLAILLLRVYSRRSSQAANTSNKFMLARSDAWILGGIFGVIFVRAFLLNEVEKIGFSLVMNNLTKISPSDFNTILNSSTFLKCVVGFFAGCVAGDFGYRAYLKNKTPQHIAPAETQTSASATTQATSQRATSESRLTELLALKEKGLITAEDYEKKRADIVREL